MTANNMTQAIHQTKFHTSKFKTFSKYDFVKTYVETVKDENIKIEKEREAAIIADAIEETQAVLLENLATKADLKALEMATKADIKALEMATKKDLEMIKKDIIIKIGSLMAIGIGIIAALIKL